LHFHTGFGFSGFGSGFGLSACVVESVALSNRAGVAVVVVCATDFAIGARVAADALLLCE
jgi:hypothetical protein